MELLLWIWNRIINALRTIFNSTSAKQPLNQQGIDMALTKVSYAMINGTPINVFDYGATGNGSTDDSAAIQAAIDAAAALNPELPSIYFPAGTYIVNSTINVENAVQFMGAGSFFHGTIIQAASTLNASVFNVTAGASFTNLTIKGLDATTNNLQRLVSIDNCNNVLFDDVTFLNSRIALDFAGSNPCFYISILNCRFENTVGGFIRIQNTSDAGVDLIMDNTRFLGDMTNYCWNWTSGLGSAIVSNVQISVTGTVPSQQLVYLGTPATYYGGAQFANCVFEGKQFALAGTVSLPWKQLWFTNCQFTAGTSSAFVFGAYATEVFFEQCQFSSTNTTGIVTFAAGTNMTYIHMDNCSWQGTGSETCLKSLGDTTLSVFVSSPSWTGYGPFINFSNVNVNGVQKLDVIGGYTGSNSTPIQLADFTNTVKNIQTYDVNYGPMQYKVFTGTLDGSGNAIIAHGINNATSDSLSVRAFYKGVSGESLPGTINYIDNTNVSISGTASRNYRCVVFYVQQNIAW